MGLSEGAELMLGGGGWGPGETETLPAVTRKTTRSSAPGNSNTEGRVSDGGRHRGGWGVHQSRSLSVTVQQTSVLCTDIDSEVQRG